MLDDLDETLRTLLIEELPQVIEKIERDGFDIRFDVPNREFKSRLAKPTLCVYLYNIQENRDLRGRTWERNHQNGSVATRRPPVRLDCSYMITAWSNEVEDEHRLLTGAARVLFRNPILPRDVLKGALADGIEITTEVAQPESFKDIVDIWSVLDNDLRPSVRVTVTVPLDVDVEYLTSRVRERELRYAQPTWTAPASEPVRITGRVMRGGRPAAGARIRDDYSSSVTNKEGEYALANIKPGRKNVLVDLEGSLYQLEASLPGDEILELPENESELNEKGPKKKSAGDGPRRRTKE